MANPTTNYSFAMPTNTDLVKDLPADFDIFGQAVDDRIKALNPETTAGDISYRASTANAKSRLAIGTAGQVLTVNSGATAPEWATISAGGITLLSTTTLSGASTTVSSISGSYTNLYVIMYGFYTSGGDQFTIKPNAANNAGRNVLGAGANLTTLVDNANVLSPGIGTSQLANNSVAYLDIVNYADTTMTKPIAWYGNATNNSQGAFMAAGNFQTTSAISSLVFAPTAGTWSGGTVKIYGVN